MLRYKAVHLSKNDTGPEMDTPAGKLHSTVLHQNESAPQNWSVGYSYDFLIERSTEGRFEVRLDGGDVQQKRLMTINGTLEMSKFAAVVLPDDPGTLMEVRGKINMGNET